MKRKLLPLFISIAGLLAACHPIEEFEQDNRGDFEALWSVLDEHYCFFAQKEVDWDDVHLRYAPKVNESLSRRQLFDLCSEMVNELRDGHTNLSSGFATSYYRAWWTDYPQNFNVRIIQENYFHFGYSQLGNIIYGVLPQNVGYIQIPSFSSAMGDGNIDWILASLAPCSGLIIDIRNNGGGNMSYAETWVRHFITSEITAGYISHKLGPGHDDFDSPRPITFRPLNSPNMVWVKPVVLLTNRSTFSAANYFTAIMRSLPQVTHAGATTGGGSGMPASYELPGGWSIRMSAVSVTDVCGAVTEHGIAPEPNLQVDMDPQAEAQGRDTMLDFAISLIK